MMGQMVQYSGSIHLSQHLGGTYLWLTLELRAETNREYVEYNNTASQAS